MSAQESCTIEFPGGSIDKISSAFLICYNISDILHTNSAQVARRYVDLQSRTFFAVNFCCRCSWYQVKTCIFHIKIMHAVMRMIISFVSRQNVLYLCFDDPAFVNIKEKETIWLRCYKIQIPTFCPKSDGPSKDCKQIWYN